MMMCSPQAVRHVTDGLEACRECRRRVSGAVEVEYSVVEDVVIDAENVHETLPFSLLWTHQVPGLIVT